MIPSSSHCVKGSAPTQVSADEQPARSTAEPPATRGAGPPAPSRTRRVIMQGPPVDPERTDREHQAASSTNVEDDE